MRDDNDEHIEEDSGLFPWLEALPGPQSAKNALLTDILAPYDDSEYQADLAHDVKLCRRCWLSRASHGVEAWSAGRQPCGAFVDEAPVVVADDDHRVIMCEAGIHRIGRYDTCALCEANGY